MDVEIVYLENRDVILGNLTLDIVIASPFRLTRNNQEIDLSDGKCVSHLENV